MPWYVYIAQCRDNSLYTGITTDISRREEEHNSDNGNGAKSLRGKRPIKIVYSESFPTESEAKKREWVIKRQKRTEKLQLIKRRDGKHSTNLSYLIKIE